MSVLDYVHEWALIALEIDLFPNLSALSKDAFSKQKTFSGQETASRATPGNVRVTHSIGVSLTLPGYPAVPEEHSTHKPQPSR